MAMLRRACVATVGLFLVCAGVLSGLYAKNPEAVLEQYNKLSLEVAQAKLALLREDALNLSQEFSTRLGEHSEVARARLQVLAADPVNSMHEFSEWFRQVYTSGKDPTLRLYFAGLKSSRNLYAAGLESTRVLVARVNEVGAAEVMREYYLQAEQTHAQLGLFAVGLIATLVASVLVVVRSIRALLNCLCRCRRHTRQSAADSVELDTEEEIMKVPTPLRHSQGLQRRRRNDSPAPIARKGDDAAQTSDENDLVAHLNNATPDELRELPGLGDKSIERILKYRKKGDLGSVGDLVTKVGIHPATYANFAKAQGMA